MNRYSIIIAIAGAFTVGSAALTPSEAKREWIVSSTPAMKGHTQHHPYDVECVPADDEFADPIYVYVNPFHQLNNGDACPTGQPRP